MKLTALQKEIKKRKGDKSKKRSREQMEYLEKLAEDVLKVEESDVKYPGNASVAHPALTGDKDDKDVDNNRTGVMHNEMGKIVEANKGDEVPIDANKVNAEAGEDIDETVVQNIKEQLQKYGEYDEALTVTQQAELLKTIIRRTAKQERYNAQKLKEDKVDKQITLEDITNNEKDKLVVQLRVFIKQLVKEWEESDYDAELLYETKKDLVLLLYKLRSDGLTEDMITSLSTICYYIQQKQYMKANESYMKLSIGNIAWPIGVIGVGIHARSALQKIEDSGSNIMIDDKTRRWITGVKRLITFKDSTK